MRKILVLATALILIGGTTKAAKKDLDVKATNNTIVESTTPATTTATTANVVSMTELMKENQQLKLALQKSKEENEVLNSKLDYIQNMYFATVSLYETQLKKQQEDAKSGESYAWMMHNVILNLNALNANK